MSEQIQENTLATAKQSGLAKWTRRGFISAGALAGGGLIVGVALRRGDRRDQVAELVAEEGDTLLSMWVKIDEAGKITAIVPHSEMGQGAQTVLTQMLADEMDANWADVSFVEAPAEDEYANGPLGKGYLLAGAEIPAALMATVDGAMHQAAKALVQQITGGSLSIRATGVAGMRVAGAAAREMMIKAAAGTWQVPESELTTANSMVMHKASNRVASYAELASAAAKFEPSNKPTLKNPEQFTLMGTDLPRHDIPSKVTGEAMFGMDAQVPGMHYAAIRQAPVFGAKVKSFDATNAKAQPGVTHVVDLEDAIAVVATGYWAAERAVKAVDIKWTATANDAVNSESIRQQFRTDLAKAHADGTSSADVEAGDVSGAFAAAAQVIEATYEVPFLAHSCMEPMNATARFANGQCEVWTGTQNPLGARHEIAAALDMDLADVALHQHVMGGGFGRRAQHDASIQAARIARDTGVPVKLIWSRAEDIQHDFYRPSVASQFRAALGSDGQVLAWDNIYNEKHEPVEAPVIPYDVAAQHIHYTDSSTHVPFGAWRSVDHSQHGFFTEAFFDEVAEAAGKDPYLLRRELLANKPRHRKLLDLAAEKAGWNQPVGQGRGRGISLQESFGTLVAQVVEVTVDKGDVSVDRVVLAVDPGFAVSPDGLTAQMESGVIYGLSAAMYGEINIEAGRVVQDAFDNYPSVRMQDAPLIETHIVNSGEAWGGAGEPGTPGIAPALANAIYQATGTRVRQLPVSRYDFNYRVNEPEELI